MISITYIAARRVCFTVLVAGTVTAVWAHDMAAMSSASDNHVSQQARTSAYPHEAPFLAENASAMDKMMADMDAEPTGDIDRDFVAMMVPHHQGAIDMAKTVLRYGKNEQIRRLAQEIIVTQQQEIAALRLAVGEKLPASNAAPTQVPPLTSAMSNDAVHSHETTTK